MRLRRSKINVALFLFASCVFATMARGQEQTMTLAGSVLRTGTEDGPAADALFHDPAGLAMDTNGNLYIADSQNHTIRKLSTNGMVTSFAGRPGHHGSADGTGTNAFFNCPTGIAVAANGALYVSDTGNCTIRHISTKGVVTTLAGTAGWAGAADSAGSLARFNAPLGIGVSSGGTIYIADSGNYTVRKMTLAGVVTTLAGLPGVWGSADGSGAAARFNGPVGIGVDASGNIFVSDANNYTIRRITPAGVVSTWAGLAGAEGSTDGKGNAARFGKPAELKIAPNGNLFVVDAFNGVIRQVDTNRVVTTVAGLAGKDGAMDGLGSLARFLNPYGLAVDHNGNLRVTDTYNETIRLVYNPITAWVGRNGDGSAVVIGWQGVVGGRYQVQYREEMDAGSWQNLGGTLIATNAACAQTDGSLPETGRRFYRIVLLP